MLIALLLSTTIASCGGKPSEPDLTSLESLYIYTQDWDQSKIVKAGRAALVDFAELGELSYDGSKFNYTDGGIAYQVDAEKNKGTIVATAKSDFGNVRIYLNEIETHRDFEDYLYAEGYAEKKEEDLINEDYKSGGAAVNVRLFDHRDWYEDKLPAIDASLAVWGEADFYLQGMYIGKKKGILWRGPGIYDENGNVWQEAEKNNLYSPSSPKKGYANPKDEEIHLLIIERGEAAGYPDRYWHFVYEDIVNPSPEAIQETLEKSSDTTDTRAPGGTQ